MFILLLWFKIAFLPITNKAIFFSFLSVLRNQQVIKGRKIFINKYVYTLQLLDIHDEAGKQHRYISALTETYSVNWLSIQQFQNLICTSLFWPFLPKHLMLHRSAFYICYSSFLPSGFGYVSFHRPPRPNRKCLDMQSLNYDTYYFLLVVKTKRNKNNSTDTEQLEHK